MILNDAVEEAEKNFDRVVENGCDDEEINEMQLKLIEASEILSDWLMEYFDH